jgi:threonine aldolase
LFLCPRLTEEISGLSIFPGILPAATVFGEYKKERKSSPPEPVIKFFGDGEMFEPESYLELLQQINDKLPIERDRYGQGGAVAALEKRFEDITGKEKAIFMPTGTMANQLAIAVLSGDNTKVFVQDTSHIYRDEADAAQSVFQKRLVPLAMDKTFFSANCLVWNQYQRICFAFRYDLYFTV